MHQVWGIAVEKNRKEEWIVWQERGNHGWENQRQWQARVFLWLMKIASCLGEVEGKGKKNE